MGNSSSNISKEIHDQYYTPLKNAEWCLTFLQNEVGWSLDGTALEPCVGTGNFVKASENLKLKLSWTTNDFFPNPSFLPDTQEDIRTLQPESKPDFIVTNPPFGSTNTLARASLKQCLTICDRVAMILPKGARRLGFLDSQPDFAHLVSDVDVPDMIYELPTGGQRTVSTCLQAWEVKDTKRPKIRDSLDLRSDFITFWASGKSNFADNGNGPADFQVCRWGGLKMNVIRDELKQSGAWMSVKVNPLVSVEKMKEVIKSVDVSDYLEKSTCNAAFDPPVWLHRVNTIAIQQIGLPSTVG